ncbi:MAG: zinc-ribbon domain-containing protein [Anaerolineales bacterium]|jgi:membrane protease subunit (stomatin/prohibitin family)|nr:zinc-ribbon domain-containing protein [Anaerolineales bacterium]
MFNTTQKCPACGANNPKDARYCSNCGKPLASGTLRCGVCQTENPGDARFCRGCGRPLQDSAAPQIVRHRWTRPEKDFAIRLEDDDLPGLLKRGVKVEPGTNALFIERGAIRGELHPGEYTLSTLGQQLRDWISGNIRERVTILLVDVTPTELEFNIGGAFTKDPLRIGFKIRLQTEVAEPGKFLINLLKGRERYSQEDLRNYLYPEVAQVAERWVRQYTAVELAEDYNLRMHLEMALEETLRTTFAQTGLRFLQVRAVEFNLENLEKIQGMASRTALINSELEARARLAEAELAAARQEVELQEENTRQISAARLRLSQAQNQAELAAAEEELKKLEAKETLIKHASLRMAALQQEVDQLKAQMDLDGKKFASRLRGDEDLINLAEDIRKTENEEQRAKLYTRMRQAVLSDKMDEVRSEAEFEKLLDQIDGEKLLRQHDREQLLRGWKWDAEDQEKNRAHLLARLDVEHAYELRMAELKGRLNLTEEEFASESRLERMRAERQIEIETSKYEFDLRRRRAMDEYDQQKAAADLRQQEMAARTNQVVAQTAHEQNMREMKDKLELGLQGLKGIKQVRREEAEAQWDLEKQKLQIQWDQQQREMETELKRERERMEYERAVKQDEHAFELSKLDKLAQLGPEALISISGVEQAKMLAKLRETEALKGMTDEQILAMAAKDSPEVAKAFQEKYRAAAAGQLSEQERKMYERMLEEQRRQAEEHARQAREDADKRAQEVSQAYQQSSQQTQDIAKHALDRLSDTAQAFAKNQPQTPASGQTIVVTPGSGGPVLFPAGGGGIVAGQNAEWKTCPECGRQLPAADKFCPFCGKEFPGIA